MIGEPWLYGALLVATLIHALGLVHLYRRARARDGDDAPDPGVGGDGVACPHCGVENERGYRFCRSCVGELPGAGDPPDAPSAPLSRGIG